MEQYGLGMFVAKEFMTNARVQNPLLTIVRQSPYMAASMPYSAATTTTTAAMTPVSLTDSSYYPAQPSPALSSHSDYPYPAVEAPSPVNPGLGLSSPYAPMIPSSHPSYSYTSGQMEMGSYGSDVHYKVSDTHRAKRMRTMRPSSTTPPARQSPVRILPHPDGLQRLEQERRQGQISESPQRETQRPRTTRGRRDPQAEEEDAYVESLRAQNLSWKVVAEMFRERFGKNSTEARLQMRMLRRRKSAAAWQEADVSMYPLSWSLPQGHCSYGDRFLSSSRLLNTGREKNTAS